MADETQSDPSHRTFFIVQMEKMATTHTHNQQSVHNHRATAVSFTLCVLHAQAHKTWTQNFGRTVPLKMVSDGQSIVINRDWPRRSTECERARSGRGGTPEQSAAVSEPTPLERWFLEPRHAQPYHAMVAFKPAKINHGQAIESNTGTHTSIGYNDDSDLSFRKADWPYQRAKLRL